ncbi:MAG TPA: hypothetical protein DCY18_09195 [Thauera sp.]|nr:hypothetical protein [Thauera sp.]
MSRPLYVSRLCAALGCMLLALLPLAPACAAQPLRIGVLAFLGSEAAVEEWPSSAVKASAASRCCGESSTHSAGSTRRAADGRGLPARE